MAETFTYRFWPCLENMETNIPLRDLKHDLLNIVRQIRSFYVMANVSLSADLSNPSLG